jgi:hypothetical protein
MFSKVDSQKEAFGSVPAPWSIWGIVLKLKLQIWGFLWQSNMAMENLVWIDAFPTFLLVKPSSSWTFTSP